MTRIVRLRGADVTPGGGPRDRDAARSPAVCGREEDRRVRRSV
ncbi:hypothetical protein HD597_002107 [Nonomuraea thailandensis]|uniref:Uncharacterized protein n=1 Tax=Nonomuraea thailandensis TaxID=1188745 RepID=A0A9X2JZA8_9ACTN|nr:hypothetical protein [Nonomuraea thailandensis]MCP2355087.1 hypothetical protein [Nonomuraea thailandensis]